ncbi:hypothetical protein HOC11_06110 [archaeon]|jgi:hypothetical protein|nr:hypothetical protein [archaeon]
MKIKNILLKPEVAIFIIVFVVLIVHMEKPGGEGANRYLDLTHAIVEEGRIEIDTFVDNTRDVAIYNNHYYSAAAPGISFIGLIPYYSFKVLYDLSKFEKTTLHNKLNNIIKENYIQKNIDPNSKFLDIDLVKFTTGNILIG